MSLLSQASLVVVPSGYKEDVVYSVKPTDGSGDLTFTRASDGTRVNSQGLVERVPWNLVQYSEDLSNAAWTKQQGTVTANATTAPNGTTTADKLIPNTTSGFHPLIQSITTKSGESYSFSVYAKAAGYNYILCNTGNGSSSGNVGPVVDLSNGTIVGSLGGDDYDAQIENVGNGWYKVSFSFTANATAVNLDINILPSSTIAVYSGNGSDGVYIWGYQLNEGTLKPYFPTTDRLNVPRLDYSNGCPSLLLEPQRTNLVTYSEQFDDAAWGKTGATIGTNAVVAPDGNTTADKLVEDTSNGVHIATQSNLFTATGAWHTASIFVKAAERTYCAFSTRGNFTSNDNTLIFNLTTGEWDLNSSGQNYGLEAEQFPNGWWRISLNTDTTSAAYDGFGIGIAIGASSWSDAVYTGDGTSGIYVWGAQLEEGSYPTSYIKTSGTSVTRVADAAYKTGISSLIGQTEGTIFAEIDFTDTNADQMYLTISDGTTNNRIHIGYDNTNDFLYCNIRSGGAAQGLISSAVGPSEGIKKIAVGYKLNDYVMYINGTQVGVDSSALVPACDRLDVGGYFTAGYEYPVNQTVLFKTRLTNAELAALTTL